MDIGINYLTVLVAGIAAYVVGAIWYSPIGFGKQWMKMMGFGKDDMRKMPLTMQQAVMLGFIFTLLISYVFAHFVVLVGAKDVAGALTLGFWTWLGFGFTTLAHSWLYEGRSLKLFIFNAAHLLVAFSAMALVYGLWQ
jgi:hypothetical protein